MAHNWTTTKLTTLEEVNELFKSVAGNRWLYRGQCKRHNKLIPSIDRGNYQNLSRSGKLDLERKSIEYFRANAKFFADEGEVPSLTDDIIALMVLRHYGVPTKLLLKFKGDTHYSYKEFYNGSMRRESKLINAIIYNRIINEFPDCIIYTIFDGLIVEEKYVEAVGKIMLEEGRKFIGHNIKVKIK